MRGSCNSEITPLIWIKDVRAAGATEQIFIALWCQQHSNREGQIKKIPREASIALLSLLMQYELETQITIKMVALQLPFLTWRTQNFKLSYNCSGSSKRYLETTG